MRRNRLIMLILVPLLVAVGLIIMVNQKESNVATPALSPDVSDEPQQEQPDERDNQDEKKGNEGSDNNKDSDKTKEKKKEKPVQESVIKDVHIVGLGDSLTKGSGDKKKEGYIKPVAQYVQENTTEEVSLKNFGIHGLPSDKLAEKMDDDDVKKHLKQADYVFITIGGNDILNTVEYNFFSVNMDLFKSGQERYRKNLFIVVQTIRSLNPDAQIYLIGMFNPFHNFFQDIKEVDGVIDEWNSTIELVADINDHTTYIPTEDLFLDEEDSKSLFSNDKLHPNHEGYLKMADRIEEYIDLPDEE